MTLQQAMNASPIRIAYAYLGFTHEDTDARAAIIEQPMSILVVITYCTWVGRNGEKRVAHSSVKKFEVGDFSEVDKAIRSVGLEAKKYTPAGLKK